MFTYNKSYRVEEYAPGFFIIGSDGGDASYAVDKQTGALHAIPFIGMLREEATWWAKDFDDFIEAKGVLKGDKNGSAMVPTIYGR